ncbi:hypothetical protein MKW92_038292 [Papaver armeniacum]|nr:hypothetical protein MKW92_038292 [Papaver armeniacum]
MCKISISKSQRNNETGDDDRPCKIHRSSSCITSLPGDCLNLIFKCLETKDERNSFGLTCREWLNIQNNNQESLWNHSYLNDQFRILQKLSPECVPEVLRKLITRFQNLKALSVTGVPVPEVTNLVILQSQFIRSKIQKLRLNYLSKYKYFDAELSLIFSWFPRLTNVSLEALAKCCSSLEVVDFSHCKSITDSGIRFLLQNCCKLRSINIDYTISITEGIEAIVSGGGLESLDLSDKPYKLVNLPGSSNTEAVIAISNACPLLKELDLSYWEGVELQGWEAIGQNCKNLEYLCLIGCRKLCDIGLQALCNGCNKLSRLYIGWNTSCSRSAVQLLKRRKPNVIAG